MIARGGVHDHRHRQVVDEHEAAAVREERVPHHQHVVEVELSAEEQPEPPQEEELRLDLQLRETRVDLRVGGAEQIVADVAALGDERRDHLGLARPPRRPALKPRSDVGHQLREETEGVGLDVLLVEQRPQ